MKPIAGFSFAQKIRNSVRSTGHHSKEKAMTEEEALRERVERCRRFGDVTGNGVVFDWELVGADGAWFGLFQEKKHTKEDIQEAKRWLRERRDVVELSVIKLPW